MNLASTSPQSAHSPRLIACQQLCGGTSARLILEVNVSERVAVMIPNDEAGVVVLVDSHGGGKRRSAGMAGDMGGADGIDTSEAWGVARMPRKRCLFRVPDA